MDTRFVNPFLNAVIRVLETMAFVKPVPGKPFLKKNRLTIGDITGIIGLTGYARGCIIFSLSTDAAIKIVSSMLGEEYTDLSDDVRDGIGELTNIIAGDARRELAENDLVFEAGIPTIIIGKGHEIESITKEPIIAIPFKIAEAPFLIEASFED